MAADRTSDGKEIKEEILKTFSSLYSPEVKEKPFVEGIDWMPISTREDKELVAPFTFDEIRKVVLSYNRNESPGFDEFFERGTLNSSLVETYVCLMPKKENANRVKEFRPISLITSVYKTLAKVLTNRLRRVMSSTIFEEYRPKKEGSVLNSSLEGL
ncbi:hypothetical protein E6C27_scaffold496G00040 [Cucumis melo var. makuwa]|uniref:Reverse transcriptase n=1 Tax=Cucumis melo var. makuwa TaxID=1194695 RepID=A0A5A7UXV6_CUCMM|nr:hypothetical protein E6C27_scaffold496G00040 [Cucumis melo var. makuwa]